MKRDSKDRRICKECSDKGVEEKNTVKEVQCVDCGKTVYVSVFDSQTNRCEDCHSIYRRKQKTETMRKLREHK